jgi:hypothetical protein
MLIHHSSEIYLPCAQPHEFYWVAQDGVEVIAQK